MTTAEPRFRDVTLDAPAPTHFPDIVAAFEELGFRQLGRLARAERSVRQSSAAYAVEHRAAFLDHKSVPMVVMTAPDEKAFALIDWWWDMAEVRIRTPMADGSIVETWRAWDRPPVLPKVLERVRDKLDIAEEHVVSSAPAGGRSIVAVPGSPADQWAAHQQRVETWLQQRDSDAVPCRAMVQAGQLGDALAVHDGRVRRRIFGITLGLLLFLLAMPLLLLLHLWQSSYLSWTRSAVYLGILVLWALLYIAMAPRWHRVRYVSWLRPAYVQTSRRRQSAFLAVVAAVTTGLAGGVAYAAFAPTDAYAFMDTQNGKPVSYDPCKPIDFVVYDRAAPPGAGLILGEAIQEVSAESGLTFNSLGTVASPADERVLGDGTSPGAVLIGWASPNDFPRLKGAATGMGGSTAVYNDRGELEYVRGVVVLDAPAITEILQRPDGRAHVRGIMMHELGHLVGLAHVDDPEQLMHESYLGQLELGAGDRAGLAAVGSGGCG